jgi:hypothetical protein
MKADLSEGAREWEQALAEAREKVLTKAAEYREEAKRLERMPRAGEAGQRYGKRLAWSAQNQSLTRVHAQRACRAEDSDCRCSEGLKAGPVRRGR